LFSEGFLIFCCKSAVKFQIPNSTKRKKHQFKNPWIAILEKIKFIAIDRNDNVVKLNNKFKNRNKLI
jgi:hypothetical protein